MTEQRSTRTLASASGAHPAQLEHGQWEKWLREEFDWSEQSARNMMQVDTRFKNTNFVDLRIDISSLYFLAAPSTLA
jgi:hypothetical protein